MDDDVLAVEILPGLEFPRIDDREELKRAELVKDRSSKEGATEETARVVNEMKERGILLSKIGLYNNILKMRPPLPFSKDNADQLLSTLDDVLANI